MGPVRRKTWCSDFENSAGCALLGAMYPDCSAARAVSDPPQLSTITHTKRNKKTAHKDYTTAVLSTNHPEETRTNTTPQFTPHQTQHNARTTETEQARTLATITAKITAHLFLGAGAVKGGDGGVEQGDVDWLAQVPQLVGGHAGRRRRGSPEKGEGHGERGKTLGRMGGRRGEECAQDDR